MRRSAPLWIAILLLPALPTLPAFAQWDEAEDLISELRETFDKMNAADDHDDNEAVYQAFPHFFDLEGKIADLTDDIPGRLSVDMLSPLAERAARMNDRLNRVKERGYSLMSKLSDRGADPSSEFSSFKDAFRDYVQLAADFNAAIAGSGAVMKALLRDDRLGGFENGMDATGPMAALRQRYDALINASSEPGKLYDLVVPMTESINAVYTLTEKVPDQLKSTPGTALMAERANDFNGAIRSLRERARALYEKVKTRGADYSSELSSLKDAYSTYRDRGEILRRTVFPAANAIRTVCPTCMS